MGIPKFGAWWLKSFPTSKIVKSKFDILCIDANAMLHQIAQYVYAYHEKSTEQDKEKVISNSFDKNIKLFTYNVINSIIKYGNESDAKSVLFFIDGPVCMAKMMQQRSRRFTSQKHMYNDKILFDSNNISPGTEFMVKFDEFFKFAINKEAGRMNFELIYSSYEEVGEGEHKFINYIRENKISQKKIGMIGLDADLFMLGSIIHNYKNEVILYRGNDYINISKVWNDLKFTESNVLDFIYAFFLIGNDFIPKMIYFYELNDNLSILWSVFSRFVKSGKSVRENFTDFLKSLKANESSLFSNLYKYFISNDVYELNSIKEITRVIKVLTTNPSFHQNKMTIEYDKFRKLLYANIVNVDKSCYTSVNEYCLKMGLNFQNYKKNQYRENEATISSVNIISTMTENFVQSLNWSYLYYTTGNVDYTWYTRYNYAPLLTDLINNYDSLNSLNFSDISNLDPDEEFFRLNPDYIDIDTQLRIIMPIGYSKNINSYGPFEIIKDNVFFPKEGFHNYINTCPFYPIDLEMKSYKIPNYIVLSKPKYLSIPRYIPVRSSDDKNSILSKDEINNIMIEYNRETPINDFRVNTEYIFKNIFPAKYIQTIGDMKIDVPKGWYLLKAINENCIYNIDQNEQTNLYKNKSTIIYLQKSITFLNNNKIILIPLVKV